MEITKDNIFELADRYYNQLLTPEEVRQFTFFLSQNADLSEEVENHLRFLSHIDYYERTISLRHKLEEFQNEVDKEAILININQRSRVGSITAYLLQASVAAAIALIIVVSSLYLSGWFDYKNRIGQYDELKKDIDNISNEQKSIWKEIFTSSKKASVRYSGTGICFSTNGFVLTNYHLIKNCDSVRLINNYDTLINYNAVVVFKNRYTDLAILRIQDSNFINFNRIPFNLNEKSDDLGEYVFTLGYSKEDIVYGEGYISSLTGFNNDTLSYEISIPVSPGISGAPLFNSKGSLIGIISGKHSVNTNSTYAIKSVHFLDALETIRNDSLSEQPVFSYNKDLGKLQRTEQIKKLKDYVFRVNVYE